MKGLSLVLLAGCTDLKSGGDGISTSRKTVTSDSSGIAHVYVDVGGTDESFLVTGESNQYPFVVSLLDPSGREVFSAEDWYGTSESITGAIFFDAKDTSFNWPIRDEDGGLDKGKYELLLGVATAGMRWSPNTDVDVVVQTKSDSSLKKGKVKALVVYAEGLGSDAEVVAGTEAAVERWEEVWGAYGMKLSVEYADGSIDPDLPFPAEAGSAISDVSAEGSNRDVTVIIGETIDGEMTYYGVAGSIPGALVDAPRSAVVISWLANAGGDGSFSEDDIRLYGETLAHEVGHYMGLFHPVEMTWDLWDALGDTAKCSSQSACESALGDNLMFPYPVCGWSSCTPQDLLSEGQEAVGQRYTGCL